MLKEKQEFNKRFKDTLTEEQKQMFEELCDLASNISSYVILMS